MSTPSAFRLPTLTPVDILRMLLSDSLPLVAAAKLEDLETLERRLSTKIVLRSHDGLELGAFELAGAPAAA